MSSSEERAREPQLGNPFLQFEMGLPAVTSGSSGMHPTPLMNSTNKVQIAPLKRCHSSSQLELFGLLEQSQLRLIEEL